MAAIVKEFKPNKRYVFSKSRFMNDPDTLEFRDSRWINYVDGTEVDSFEDSIIGLIKTNKSFSGYFKVNCNWCKQIR